MLIRGVNSQRRAAVGEHLHGSAGLCSLPTRRGHLRYRLSSSLMLPGRWLPFSNRRKRRRLMVTSSSSSSGIARPKARARLSIFLLLTFLLPQIALDHVVLPLDLWSDKAIAGFGSRGVRRQSQSRLVFPCSFVSRGHETTQGARDLGLPHRSPCSAVIQFVFARQSISRIDI